MKRPRMDRAAWEKTAHQSLDYSEAEMAAALTAPGRDALLGDAVVAIATARLGRHGHMDPTATIANTQGWQHMFRSAVTS